jgi:hypothetical protein
LFSAIWIDSNCKSLFYVGQSLRFAKEPAWEYPFPKKQMDDLLELVLELLFNRFGAFILGILLVVGGVFVWLDYRGEAKLYDAAIGSQGVAVTAKVVSKPTTDMLRLRFPVSGQDTEASVEVDQATYNKYKEGDTLEVRYPQTKTDYIVLPSTKRPTMLWPTIGGIALMAAGAIIMVVVVVSFFF